MWGLAAMLGAGLVLAWALAVVGTARMIGWPARRGYGSAVARGQAGDPSELARARRFEEWRLRSEACGGVEVVGWTIEGDDAGGPVVVFCHGWGESRQSVLGRLEALGPVCSRVIAWDLPGHGESSRGRAWMGTSEWRVLEEVVGVAMAGVEGEGAGGEGHGEAGDGRRQVVLQGFSLGAGVCLRLAAERPGLVSGVIAEAPYRLAWTPAERVIGARGLPTRGIVRPALWLLGVGLESGPRWRGFDRAAIAGRVRCPVVVVHGEHDGVSPVEDGRAIASACGGRLEVISSARHNDLWTSHAGASGAVVRGFVGGVARG